MKLLILFQLIVTTSVTRARLFPKLFPDNVTFVPWEISPPTIIIHPVDDLKYLFRKMGAYVGLCETPTIAITTTTPMAPVTEYEISLVEQFYNWFKAKAFSDPKRRYKDPILRPLEIFYPSLRKRHSTKFVLNLATAYDNGLLV